MDIADEADRSNQHAFRGESASQGTGASVEGPSADDGPAPMLVGAVSAAKRWTGVKASIVIRTPAEIRRLREENRCFNCRETGHGVQDCPKAPDKST